MKVIHSTFTKTLTIGISSIALAGSAVSALAASQLNLVELAKPSAIMPYKALLNAPTGHEAFEKQELAKVQKEVERKFNSTIVHEHFSFLHATTASRIEHSLPVHEALEQHFICHTKQQLPLPLLVEDEFKLRTALSSSSILSTNDIIIVYSTPAPSDPLHLASVYVPVKPIFTFAKITDDGIEIISKPHAELAQLTKSLSPFNNFETVGNDVLAETRGAFITSSGLVVDFGLVTQTLVNSEVVSQTEVITNNGTLEAINSNELQQLVQVTSEGAINVQGISSDQLPSVLTVIQNSANDQVIQNLTTLNLDVSNLQAFKEQSLSTILNNQAINAQ